MRAMWLEASGTLPVRCGNHEAVSFSGCCRGFCLFQMEQILIHLENDIVPGQPDH